MRVAAILAVLLAGSTAVAQGNGLGVGAEATVGTGTIAGGGATVVYDLELMYIEGSLAFEAGDGPDAVNLGAAFYYKLAATEASDFSVGGGAALLFVDPDGGGPFGGGDADLGVALHLGAKIRAFLVANVAVQVGLGLSVLIDDQQYFTFNSRLAGSAGMVYFF